MTDRLYLVLARHTMDDVPIAIFKTEAAAKKFAQDEKAVQEAVDNVATKVLGIDTTTFIDTDIIVFDDGKPVDVLQISIS